MNYRAFIEDDDTPYRIEYYHNPRRWIENNVDTSNAIMKIENWSSEIKYMNHTYDDVSNEIKSLPNDKGGVYMFYIKGICLPFIENYIVYIGRCKSTDNQNIKKRAKEYFANDYIKGRRQMIQKMFNHWKEYLYYRCYLDNDNDRIDLNESYLIRAILPPYNEVIPDKVEIQPTTPAF
jgi:hypothetical protein